VVAEFVGDQETRQQLLAMGVHLGQGAFLGPSRDIMEIDAFKPKRKAPTQ
jgi:EAL domain-containing protein (putative c-di-GMP-specific phosphodiesterase class I)